MPLAFCESLLRWLSVANHVTTHMVQRRRLGRASQRACVLLPTNQTQRVFLDVLSVPSQPLRLTFRLLREASRLRDNSSPLMRLTQLESFCSTNLQ